MSLGFPLTPAAAEDEVKLLKERMTAQQKEIQELRAALEAQRKLLERILPAIEALAARPVGTSTASPESMTVDLSSASPTASEGVKPRAASDVPSALPFPAQDTGSQEGPPSELELVKGELEAVAESAHETNQRVGKLEAGFADAEKRNAARVRGLGNFNFGGDVRLRYEPFYKEGIPTRHRERVRLRLNITGKVTDEISGGVSLATGTLEDVNSTNQTMTGFFTRKNIGIDRMYMTYKPTWFKPMSVSGGKFAYNWVRSPLTFDSDINPEGFGENFSFDIRNPVLKNITVSAFQLPLLEVAGGYNSGLYGGQLQTRWKLSDKTNLGLHVAGLNFNRANPIAVAQPLALNPSLPNSNTVVRDAGGNVIGYAYSFLYLDIIGQIDYALNPRFPITVLFDFVNNTRGGHQRSGYWGDITFGKLREAKDIQFGYSNIWIEKDAVLGAFNESDLRSSTNVRNHRFLFGYQAAHNLTLQWTMWYGRLADPFQNTALLPPANRSACITPSAAKCEDTYLNRMQFDFTYRF
jgi:hypothetical protein